MAHSLAFSEITLRQVEELSVILSDKPKAEHYLANLFHLEESELSQDAIILDFYYYNLVFAEECGFTAEKISAFFSIMKETFFKSLEHSNLTYIDALNKFKQLLIAHSVNRPPQSVQIFSFDDVAKITEYAVDSFFAHLKLYQYVFVQKDTLALTTTDVFRPVDVPQPFPPMVQALPEDIVLEKVMVWEEEEPVQVLRDQLEEIDLSTVSPEIIQQAIQAALHSQIVELKRAQRQELEEVEKQLLEKAAHPELGEDGTDGKEEKKGGKGKDKKDKK
ncbi:MAG: hypothetical protein EZS28_026334 [Streblomastix strix]|uniref:Coiled-coil domain-containing protein 189 n=1 Tax=Streblomastix strix TaxID=222440 RepID=A0A5J4V711_9EUKA|nr:MAG: hypothetical protein EZS28_026334 [Streblomastix strix]